MKDTGGNGGWLLTLENPPSGKKAYGIFEVDINMFVMKRSIFPHTHTNRRTEESLGDGGLYEDSSNKIIDGETYVMLILSGIITVETWLTKTWTP